MGFIRDLFGNTKKSTKTAPVSGVAKNELEIGGQTVEDCLKELFSMASREGWNAYASAEARCADCEARYEIKEFSGVPRLISNGALEHLDQPFCCENCESTKLKIKIEKATFKEWLERVCNSIEKSKENPGEGFNDVERGGIILDHGLSRENDFEKLWSKIGNSIDLSGGMNANGYFNLVFSKSSHEYHKIDKISCIIHVNYGTKERTTIIKGVHNDFWYSVEKT